jgi:hypothetical protein
MSCQSANEKGDNMMIPGVVHRFPDICLTVERKRMLPVALRVMAAARKALS